jgi:hypothetical protein
VRVTQYKGQIIWPDISRSGRIIPPSPPQKMAKDSKRLRCASLSIWGGYYGRRFPVLAELSGPNLDRIIRPWRQQQLQLQEGYKCLSPSSSPSCSSCSRTRHYLEPPKLLDLHFQPFKALDLWRIEGGDPDLHLHRRNFISLSIRLGNLCLVVPWKH